MERLIDFLKKLSKERNHSIENLTNYKDQLINIYSVDKEFRHEYSKVTRVLYEIENQEDKDGLCEKLKDILELVPEESKVEQKQITKLLDHINLENIRLIEIQKINNNIDNTTRKVTNATEALEKSEKAIANIDEKIKKVKKKIEKVNEDIDNNNMKSVTVLGIFASIVISFTGGLTFVASALENASALNKYKLVLIVILLATAIFDIIYMLIYLLGKLTKTYIGSNCNCNNKFEGCEEKSIKCAIVRYPMAVLFNLLSSISIVILIITYAIDKYDLLTKLLKAESVWVYLGIIGIVGLIFLLICMVIRLIVIQECNYEYFDKMPTVGIRFRGYRKKEEKKNFFPWIKKRKNELDIE